MKQNSIRSFFVKSGPTLKRARVDAGTTDVAVASSDTATAKVIPTLEESASAQDSQLSSEDLTSAVAGDSLFLSLDADWRGILSAELRKPYIHSLEQFVTREYNTCTVYPPKADIFAALNACPLSQIKVVVLGQDPYHGPDQAHGLSFSVQKGIPPPPSLKNIYKELMSDIPGFRPPSHGFLEHWAQQGVLMLNTTLTVRKGEPNSHAKRGWESFTDAVIRQVANQEGVVFLLWGKPAQTKCEFISSRSHRVITTSHPSPLGATKTNQPFIGSRCFSRCNQYLIEMGKTPINWKLD